MCIRDRPSLDSLIYTPAVAAAALGACLWAQALFRYYIIPISSFYTFHTITRTTFALPTECFFVALYIQSKQPRDNAFKFPTTEISDKYDYGGATVRQTSTVDWWHAFSPHDIRSASLPRFPLEFRDAVKHEETSVMGLSSSEDPMILAWVVLTQCQTVTDGQTDRQTDGRIYDG